MSNTETVLQQTIDTLPEERLRASDLDFYSLLRRQADEGRLFFNQRRAILFDAEAMGTLRRELIETLDQELARGVLTRFGYTQGYKDAEMLAENFDWATDQDWLAAGSTLHMLEGIVRVESQEIEFDRATGHFYMRGLWRNSYEAEEHLKHYGLAGQPVCWTLAGYASGYASRFFGRDLLAIETKCLGKGDDCCHWEIRPIPQWGAKAELYLRALQPVNISGQARTHQTDEASSENARLNAFTAEIGLALTRNITLHDTLQECAEVTVKHLGAAFARIWTFNPLENMLELRASAGMYTHIDGGHARVPVGKFKIGLIAEERQPHLTNDVLNDPRVGDKKWAKREGMVAFAGYPLIVEDRLVGVMAMFARNPLPENVLQALGAVANIVALSIDHKQTTEMVAKRADELATVTEVSTTALMILETDRLLWEVADLTKKRFALYHAHIYLLNEAGDMLNLVAGAGKVGRKMVAQGWSIPLEREQSLVAQAARTLQGVIANDVRENPDFLPNPLLPDTRSELAVPMIVGDAVLGVLDVQSDRINYFTQEDIFTKTILANQIASAIQNARLFEGVIQAQQELAVVNKVLQEVGRQRDLEQLLQTVYEQIQHIVPTDAFFVGLYDSATGLINYPLIYDNNQRYEQAPAPASPGSNVESVLATGEAVLINHTSEEMRLIQQSLPENAIGDETKSSVSLLYLPLRLGQRTLGVMSVQSYQFEAYTKQDITLLGSIANQVSVAVENIRLYQQTEKRARREQILREVTARIRSSVDVEAVLRTAAQEVGQALNRPTFVYLDNSQKQPTPETKE